MSFVKYVLSILFTTESELKISYLPLSKRTHEKLVYTKPASLSAALRVKKRFVGICYMAKRNEIAIASAMNGMQTFWEEAERSIEKLRQWAPWGVNLFNDCLVAIRKEQCKKLEQSYRHA